ncbi:hypothetical protein D1B33_06710 [Lysinibacillus yapensis]|uniref:DUF2157 domain-containing protein n=1 Tax=Ureibacillus yapensis TaxID=2304605 RepID=A0A396SB21_9BACL|nr:hypothetical protein [Lysinibacillus yapensis]RHW38561.1 hypothetical protein D1B33_06710 [Lysinibacillus yapensis]
MPNPRQKIILNEILFWKQNKLLPEHYCDFLMTLYSEGNELELEDEISPKKSLKAKEKNKKILSSILAAVFTIALIAILFLASNLTWLVAIMVGFVAILLFIFAFRLAKKEDVLAPILQVSSALLFFGLCVKVGTEYFSEQPFILLGLLTANCILWLLTGFKFKLLYFTISGIVGLLVLIGYFAISFF